MNTHTGMLVVLRNAHYVGPPLDSTELLSVFSPDHPMPSTLKKARIHVMCTANSQAGTEHLVECKHGLAQATVLS